MTFRRKNITPLVLLGIISILLSGCNTGIKETADTPIINSISSDSTTNINESITLNIDTSVTDNGKLTYQWYAASEDKLADGITIVDEEGTSGANTSAFKPDVSKAGIFYYYCIITNTLGTSSSFIISPRISVTVTDSINALMPVILIMPKNVSCEIDETFSFEVSAYTTDEGNLSYQWYFSEKEEDEGSAIEDSTKNKYEGKLSVSNVGFYYCIITNTITDNGDGGIKSATTTTNKAQLSNNIVNANKPQITAEPASIKEVIPATGTFTVGAISLDEGTLTYQWYKVGTVEDTPIEDATNKTLEVSINEEGTTSYYCIITNTITDNGDGGTKTAVIKSGTANFEAINYNVAISPFITIVKTPSLFNIANPNTTLTFEVEIPSYTVKYVWYESSDGTVNTGSIITPTTTNGADTRTFTTPNFTERGIHYYYCSARIVLSNSNNNMELEIAKSDVVSVAYTGLPTLYLDTGDTTTSEITQDSYFLGSFKIISEQYGTFEYEFTKTDKTTGKTKEGIKGRGNSSWTMPKKGYNIKFDSKKSILGMPEDKKWCIIANYNDKTLLRNKYASILGNEIYKYGYNPTFVIVDVIMNGEYLGNYIFGEKNSISKDRINIQDIADCTEKKINNGKYVNKNDDSIIDLNDGGFVLEIDHRFDGNYKFVSSKGVPFILKDPDEVTTETLEHIIAIVQRAEDTLYSDNFSEQLSETSNKSSWMQYCNVDSFIDWYIVNEFAKNRDAHFGYSVYMYYNPSDCKLHIGPNWDFDIAFGNDGENGIEITLQQPLGWWIKSSDWISRMFEDPQFVTKLKTRWNEKKSELQKTFASNGTIQTLADSIRVSAEYNFKKWPILGTYVWPNPAGYENRTTYQSEVDYMKTWLSTRYNWLDTAINEL